MKILVLVAVLGASAPLVAVGQTRPAAPRQQATPPAPAPDRTAEAYAQFLQAHVLADDGKTDEAIAAYRRAMMLDATSATIPAELAELFFGENRPVDAQGAAEQALKVDDTNKQAHRVLGQVHAGLAGNAPNTRAGRAQQQEHVTSAIEHLEKSLETPVKLTDIDVRALLGRLYVAAEQFDKAIPLLADIVKEAPAWRDGPSLLMEAYAGAGKTREAVTWLEESAPDNPQLYSSLAASYARERRWVDAASTYDLALEGILAASTCASTWRPC